MQAVLVLRRRVRRDDFPWMLAMWRDPQVRRFLFDDHVVPEEQAEDILEQALADAAVWGGGLWALHEPAGGPPIGFVGFVRSRGADPGVEERWPSGLPELIYGLAPSHWHRGYATSAAVEALRHAFGELRLERVLAASDTPNIASRRVLERLGMRLVAEGTMEGRPTLLFELRREEFLP